MLATTGIIFAPLNTSGVVSTSATKTNSEIEIFHPDYLEKYFAFEYAIRHIEPILPPPPPRVDDAELKKTLDAYNKKAKIAVSVTDLTTGETLIEYNADRVFTSASTYKLFTAYDIYNRIENKKLKRGDFVGGSAMSDCIALMIVYSDNYCVEAWLDASGFDNATKVAAKTGAKNTKFEPWNMRTNAADLSTFLEQLYNGDLLNEKNTAEFLEHMKTQVWRDGIPAALEPDTVVYDKIGKLDDITHDAAVIESEKGNFTFVILTEFDDYAAVKKIAADVYDLL